MGFASASKTDKLKMMKTNRTKKTNKKIKKLAKSKKISRNIIEQYKDIKSRKMKGKIDQMMHIEDDWADERIHRYDDDAEALPLDMLDADIDWENSAFAGEKRRLDAALKEEEEENEEKMVEARRRRFDGEVADDKVEMLPIKLKDGTLIRKTKDKDIKEEDEEAMEADEAKPDEDENKFVQEDFSHLSAIELLAKRSELLEEAKEVIADLANSLLANPQENVTKLRDLFHLCQGQKIHNIIRESVQKLAMASFVQVEMDILPGYSIRELTEEEKKQKQTKETRKLHAFEESLLRYHLKFLQLCEKQSGKIRKDLDESTFTYKIGVLSLKAMCRVLISAPHFNYSTNIVAALVKLSICQKPAVLSEICSTLSKLFKEDVNLKISAFTTRTVATFTTKRGGRVPPQLVATFLDLNVTEVKTKSNKNEKDRLTAKKYKIKKEHVNKSHKKYRKQLDRLEADLKELDEAETLNDKLKYATETMKFVFQCYFSVLRRLANVQLLEPVLEGLSKYAHLLSIEFFGDVISTMGDLVDQQHLRVVDRLHCVHCVFVILSGDGQILNIDPARFYKNVYGLLRLLPFERNPEQRRSQVAMLLKTLDLMLNARRKQVPMSRVTSYVQRLLTIASVLDDISALGVVAFVRTLFVSFPKLTSLVTSENDDEEGGPGAGPSSLHLSIDDPDVAPIREAEVQAQLRMLGKRRYKPLNQFAYNILNGIPSTGMYKVLPNYTSVKPWELMSMDTEDKNSEAEVTNSKYLDDIIAYCKKRKQTVTSENILFHISNWVTAKVSGAVQEG